MESGTHVVGSGAELTALVNDWAAVMCTSLLIYVSRRVSGLKDTMQDKVTKDTNVDVNCCNFQPLVLGICTNNAVDLINLQMVKVCMLQVIYGFVAQQVVTFLKTKNLQIWSAQDGSKIYSVSSFCYRNRNWCLLNLERTTQFPQQYKVELFTFWSNWWVAIENFFFKFFAEHLDKLSLTTVCGSLNLFVTKKHMQ